MAEHPIVGLWNLTTPIGPALCLFFPDGTAIFVPPATQAGPNGVEFVSSQPGTWEAVSERGIHFTGVQLHSDANGNYIGSVTVDAHPTVNDDGQTLLDDQTATVTIRDAAGNIVQEISVPGDPPATGIRMRVGDPDFHEVAAATPTS
jgi:hypothetical protein